MTREIHRVAFILQDSNSGYANHGSGEEGDYSNVLVFPGEVKTETLLHPFKPKSSYVRSYLPGFLQSCPHPFTSSLYGVNSGVPRADFDPSNATALSSSQRAGCYDNPYSLWGAGCTQPFSSPCSCCFCSLPTGCILGSYSQSSRENSGQCYLMKVMPQAKGSRGSHNGTYNFKIQFLHLMEDEDLLGQCSASWALYSATQTTGRSAITARINAFELELALISLTHLNHRGCNSSLPLPLNCRASIAFKLQNPLESFFWILVGSILISRAFTHELFSSAIHCT